MTRLKLRKYEIVGRPEEVRSWLYHQDGALGQEVAVAFLSWGMDNQTDFELIVDGMVPAEKPGIISWAVAMIGTNENNPRTKLSRIGELRRCIRG